MRDSGFMETEMDRDVKLFLTVAFTMENGDTIKYKAKVKWSMWMGTYLKENGAKTKLTALASIPTTMAPSTKGIGLTISKMGKVSNSGLTAANTRDSSKMERSMAKELIYGLMVVITQVLGKKTNFQGTVSISGFLGGPTRESGCRTKCMEREFTSGRMVVDMRASTTMIKSTGLGNIFGQTVKFSKVNGSTAREKGKGSIMGRMV